MVNKSFLFCLEFERGRRLEIRTVRGWDPDWPAAGEPAHGNLGGRALAPHPRPFSHPRPHPPNLRILLTRTVLRLAGAFVCESHATASLQGVHATEQQEVERPYPSEHPFHVPPALPGQLQREPGRGGVRVSGLPRQSYLPERKLWGSRGIPGDAGPQGVGDHEQGLQPTLQLPRPGQEGQRGRGYVRPALAALRTEAWSVSATGSQPQPFGWRLPGPRSWGCHQIRGGRKGVELGGARLQSGGSLSRLVRRGQWSVRAAQTQVRYFIRPLT